jgi:hypothetical protein
MSEDVEALTKLRFQTDPLTSAERNALLSDQPIYSLALSPNRNFTPNYFNMMGYFVQYNNAVNTVIKGLSGTGKSLAGLISAHYLKTKSNREFGIDNIYYSVSDILRSAKHFDRGHILFLDEWRGITNVGEGGMTETQELIDIEGITREEQINFIHCSNLLPQTTLRKCKHLLEMFDIDYVNCVSRALLLSKQTSFHYPVAHVLFPDIRGESCRMIKVDGKSLEPCPEFYDLYLKKKRDYMATVRKRSGLGKFETHIDAAMECMNDPKYVSFNSLKTRISEAAKKNYISAKFQQFPISIKKRIYQLTLIEAATPGYLESLFGIMKQNVPEAIEAQVAENEKIAEIPITKEDVLKEKIELMEAGIDVEKEDAEDTDEEDGFA